MIGTRAMPHREARPLAPWGAVLAIFGADKPRNLEKWLRSGLGAGAHHSKLIQRLLNTHGMPAETHQRMILRMALLPKSTRATSLGPRDYQGCVLVSAARRHRCRDGRAPTSCIEPQNNMQRRRDC